MTLYVHYVKCNEKGTRHKEMISEKMCDKLPFASIQKQITKSKALGFSFLENGPDVRHWILFLVFD